MFESPAGGTAEVSGGWIGLQIHFGMHHKGSTEDLWDTSSLDPGEFWQGTDAPGWPSVTTTFSQR